MSEKKHGFKLKTVVEEVLKGVRTAQHLGDLETAQLNEVYLKNPVLGRLSLPAFRISDIEFELHFNILESSEKIEAGKTPDMTVDIVSDKLTKLEPHQVQTMKLKISPVNLRVFEEEKKK